MEKKFKKRLKEKQKNMKDGKNNGVKEEQQVEEAKYKIVEVRSYLL